MSSSPEASNYSPVVLQLLGTDVLPARSEPFERMSAAIAVRCALASRTTSKTLVFLVPEGTSTTARYVLAGLLAANYAHANGFKRLPPAECQPFLKSQVLLITPAVSESLADLQSLHLAGAVTLSDLWDVMPLARQAPKAGQKQRVFLANPGWALARMSERRYSAVIIDATHPRTLARLDDLLALARNQSPLGIVIAPGLPPGHLAAAGISEGSDLWLWDPMAKTSARNALNEGRREPSPKPANHPLLVCEGDSEANEVLEAAYREIAGVTRTCVRSTYPGLSLVWSILNRLRTLTVPLTVYEQAATKSWSGGVAARIKMLDDVAGHGQPTWDLTWPRVRSTLEAAYAAFIRRNETAKFWALAERLDELLRDRQATYRLVTPSGLETTLLTSWLQDIIDCLPEAIAEGRLDIVTYADEARQVAEGLVAHTILLGPRPAKYRYLSLYPSQPQEELLYPFEVAAERARIARQYAAAAALQTNQRAGFLETLNLGMMVEVTRGQAPSPRAEVFRSSGRSVTQIVESAVEADFDFGSLIASESELRAYTTRFRAPAEKSGKYLQVVYAGGLVVEYPIEQLLDVYYEETDVIKRESVEALAPGSRVIRFVDGQYDSLFERTKEAIQAKLPLRDRMSLELWEIAKRTLVRTHDSKQTVYDLMRRSGLESTYSTFLSWFREDAETIAPQTLEQFAIIAKASGVFRSDKQLRGTYTCIQHVRGRNRRAGRQLRALLRAVISRDGYEDALENVRKVDPDLADAYAAVDVVEVLEVRLDRTVN